MGKQANRNQQNDDGSFTVGSRADARRGKAGNGGDGGSSGATSSTGGRGVAGYWLCRGCAGKPCGHLVPRGESWCNACGNQPPAHISAPRPAPAAGKGNGKGASSGDKGTAASTPSRALRDFRFDWICGNCSDNGPVTCSGKAPCSCGRQAPAWVRRGLTHNEHLLEIAKAKGNRTETIEGYIRRERSEARRRELAKDKVHDQAAPGNGNGKAAGKGSSEVQQLRARVAELEARDKAKAADGPTPSVEPVPKTGAADNTKDDEDMGGSHRDLQAQARVLEARVKAVRSCLQAAIAASFGDKDHTELDIIHDPLAGAAQTALDEALEELEALRVQVRASRPIDLKVDLKRRELEALEPRVVANRAKAEEQAAAVEDLEERLKAAKSAHAETLATADRQERKAAQLREELGNLRREQVTVEYGDAPEPEFHEAQETSDVVLGEAMVARARGDVSFRDSCLFGLAGTPEGIDGMARLVDQHRAAMAEHARAQEAQQRAAAAEQAAAAAAAAAAGALAPPGATPPGDTPPAAPGSQAPVADDGSLPRGPVHASGFTPPQAAAALAARDGARTPPARSRSPGGRAALKAGRIAGKPKGGAEA